MANEPMHELMMLSEYYICQIKVIMISTRAFSCLTEEHLAASALNEFQLIKLQTNTQHSQIHLLQIRLALFLFTDTKTNVTGTTYSFGNIWQCWWVGPPIWSRLKYFINYWMDYHEICWHSWLSDDDSPDFSSCATMGLIFFGFEVNVFPTITRSVIAFGIDIHVPQRLNFNHLCLLLNFPVAPRASFHLTSKISWHLDWNTIPLTFQCHSQVKVSSKISQHPPDGLRHNLLQIFMFPRGWISVMFVFPWHFL